MGSREFDISLSKNTINNKQIENPFEILKIYLLLFLVAIVWGASWPAGRKVATNLPPVTAAFYRFTIAVPFFFLAAYLIDRNISIPRSMHRQIAILGFLQVTLYNLFFFSGERYTSSSDATLIIAINPTITAILAARIYSDEKLSRQRIYGLLIALSGVVIIVIQSPNKDVENRFLGNFLIILAAITWATFTVYSRPVFKKINPLTFSAWASLYGWLLLLILSPVNGNWIAQIQKTDTIIWLSLVYLALAAGVFGNIVFNSSVGKIGPSRSSIFINLVPIFGVISAVILLDEIVSYWHAISLGLIIIGVYQVNRTKVSSTK